MAAAPPSALKKILFVAAFAFAEQAWAVNKCTGPDGRVAFQDAPCASNEKAATIEVPTSRSGEASEIWQFIRQKDDMTGRLVCFAVLPSFYAGYRLGGKSYLVNVQVAVTPETTVLSIRTPVGLREQDLFHNDLAGMGMKVGDNAFTPISRKISSQAVGFSSDEGRLLLQQLGTSASFRLRLRYWPYEELHDTTPKTTRGFQQAMKLAEACARTP